MDDTYENIIKTTSSANSCVADLARYMERGPNHASSIIALGYSPSLQTPPNPHIVDEDDLHSLVTTTGAVCGRLLIVENIRPRLISLLGKILDVDPMFFAGHVTTHFQDIEKAPPPPSLALFPSQIAERGFLHLHYQQMLDLGGAVAFEKFAYAFKTSSNIPRNIRRLPSLSGRQLALARSCCSILFKKTDRSWTCLILVDPPIKSVVEMASKPLHGGFEDFEHPISLASFDPTSNNRSWDKSSMLSSLLHYFRNHPPGFEPSSPTVLSLGYYPIRIVLAEWLLYTQVTSRYFKYYEYVPRDIQNRLHNNDIADLQRWRRRIVQSQHKLRALINFVRYWIPQEVNKLPWNMVLEDIDHILWHLEHSGNAFQEMIPVATSMVQLLDSQRSILQTSNVTRLTYIALIFVPLSWVASLFSMSDEYSPGQSRFWVYIATALPVLMVVLLISIIQRDKLVEKLERLRGPAFSMGAVGR